MLAPAMAQHDASLSAQTVNEVSSCRVEPLRVERLPSLNIPRYGHSTLMIDGCPTVFGGHTTAFVPTATAEYLSGGEWHVMTMAYNHDFATACRLQSGQVLIAGGCEQPLGIGQTFTIELYDPAQHTFCGYGCLEKKRTLAQAIELDSAQVYITGNWYGRDGVELFNGSRQNLFVKEVTQSHGHPYLLRTAADNFMVLSYADTYSHPHDTVVADQLHGDPLVLPLFQQWHPLPISEYYNWEDGFIGTIDHDVYANLMAVGDSSGQAAIALLRGTEASLLPTACPLPVTGPDGDTIVYLSSAIVDRRSQRSYMLGRGTAIPHVLYVLAIDYEAGLSGGEAPLTLYVSDPADSLSYSNPRVTPEGHLFMAGGIIDNNYTPTSEAVLLCVGDGDTTLAAAKSDTMWWPWLLLVLFVILVVCIIVWRRTLNDETTNSLNDQTNNSPDDQTPNASDDQTSDAPDDQTSDTELMSRVVALIEQEQLFRSPGLKLADVAQRLEVSARRLSTCLNTNRGCSFSKFLNTYRVDYAKQLMLTQPDIKISAVCEQAGFANEVTFFRTFKDIVGKPPKEWMSDHAEKGLM